jgi:hypothetical protein
MNPISLTGAFVITFSLLAYGIGIISLARFKLVSTGVLVYITTGVVLDIIGAVLMIVASSRSPFTMHALLGFSGLLVMLINALLLWRYFRKNGSETWVSGSLLLYSKLAYLWWMVAYILGSLLIIWRF